MKKILMSLPLLLSLLSPVHAATVTTSGCPDPSLISTIPLGIPGLSSWEFIAWYGGGVGLGGSQVGSLVSQNQMAPGTYMCYYNTNLSVSKADIYKKIDELSEKDRSYVQYLRGSNEGFLLVTEIPANK